MSEHHRAILDSTSEETRGNLTLERYAFILAHTLHFTPDDSPEVLARLGVSAEDWEAAAKGWRAEMAGEVRREENARIAAFGAAFAAARSRLRAERPPVAALGPLPEEKALEGAAAGEVIAKGAAGAAGALSAAVTSGSPGAGDAPEGEGRMPQVAPPARRESPLSVSVSVAPVRSSDARPAGAPSPWASRPDGAGKPAVRAPSLLAGTSLSLDVPRGEALPFAKGAAPAGVSAPSPVEAAEKKARPRVPEELGGTSLSLDVPRGPVLPFPGAPPAPPRPPAPAPPPSARQTAASPPAAPPAAAPPAAAPPAAAPPLPMERHASLCVELTVAPDRAAETLLRYRMTPEAKALADTYWRSRFEQDPEVRRAWEQAYNAYYTWLRSTGANKG